ncbi:MAG: type II secretion system protein [Verrucomicrobiales bacterium]|nr:type II secretion system protein [Verrucomicrobiales bacterium]
MHLASHPQPHRRRSGFGFSLVEMLAAVAIMGVIAFLAIPSVTRMRSDAERNLAISRAESLNLAQSSFIQVRGRGTAETLWIGTGASNESKYQLLRPYLSFSETTLTRFLPGGYNVQFPASVLSMTKVGLVGPSGIIPY